MALHWFTGGFSFRQIFLTSLRRYVALDVIWSLAQSKRTCFESTRKDSSEHAVANERRWAPRLLQYRDQSFKKTINSRWRESTGFTPAGCTVSVLLAPVTLAPVCCREKKRYETRPSWKENAEDRDKELGEGGLGRHMIAGSRQKFFGKAIGERVCDL